jgi:CDP-4-dehydro-6-deoxyglucose reductase
MDDEAMHRVVGAERRTPSIRELWLRPLGAPLRYRPGEYVLVEDLDLGIPPRSYSIANAPRADGLISLLVTRVPGGRTSTWIHDRLRVGDEVSVSGPYGTFVDDPTSTAPGLFLAAGSGLAPIRALMEAALSTGARESLTLIVSARTEADVIDRERFVDWMALHRRFGFIRTLTRAEGPGPHGRIPAVLPSTFEALDDHDVFIAGAPGFVRACAASVELLGPAARSAP